MMTHMNDSYFKASNGNLYFFNTEVLASVRSAYDRAKADTHDVSAFKVPTMSGPWDKLGVVGHRSRQEIMQDLAIEVNSEAIAALHLELDGIARKYLAVGRVLPMQAVAA